MRQDRASTSREPSLRNGRRTMNPLFNQRQTRQQPDMRKLLQMMGQYTPEQARAEVERIAAERGYTPDQMNRAIEQAQGIARILGIS